MAQLSQALPMPTRSLGVKLVVVCFLALLMTIPALFVWALIDDRSNRADQVVREVGGLVGGPQTFLGPVLTIPYSLPGTATKAGEHGVYFVFPARGEVAARTHTEIRHRSLFKVPVYRTDATFSAAFDLSGVPAHAPEGAVLDWNRAEFLVGASDARGALSDIMLNAAGKEVTLGPAAALAASTVNLPQAGESSLTFFGTSAAEIAKPDARFDVTATLKFSGAQRIAILAFAKTTTVAVTGDWQAPSYNGGVLPSTQKLDTTGFAASWSVPYIARGIPAEGVSDIVGRLGSTAMGVSFVEPADAYQSVTRSLKYALLFIGLVFLSYFLFEVTSGNRIHPAQYILIGVAQVIFYLLLLSIAERLGFGLAFLIAAGATVTLISAYAGWVFASRTYGLRALGAFSVLYALIYVLLRLEDQALLVGALASFAAIAAVMYFTRHMDWYGPTASLSSPAMESRPSGG